MPVTASTDAGYDTFTPNGRASRCLSGRRGAIRRAPRWPRGARRMRPHHAQPEPARTSPPSSSDSDSSVEPAPQQTSQPLGTRAALSTSSASWTKSGGGAPSAQSAAASRVTDQFVSHCAPAPAPRRPRRRARRRLRAPLRSSSPGMLRQVTPAAISATRSVCSAGQRSWTRARMRSSRRWHTVRMFTVVSQTAPSSLGLEERLVAERDDFGREALVVSEVDGRTALRGGSKPDSSQVTARSVGRTNGDHGTESTDQLLGTRQVDTRVRPGL